MRWTLIDKIEECVPGVSAQGVKMFSEEEEFFSDHFPGHPIVPGVLQIEMIAQLGGKCLRTVDASRLPVLTKANNFKFYRSLRPNEVATIKIDVIKKSSLLSHIYGQILHKGKKVSQGDVFFGFIDGSVLTSTHFDNVIENWRSENV